MLCEHIMECFRAVWTVEYLLVQLRISIVCYISKALLPKKVASNKEIVTINIS